MLELRPRFAVLGLLMAGLGFSSPASAFPWDWDMVDAQFFRAYEWAMMTLPDGAVTRDRFVPNYNRMTPEGQALTNPLTAPSAADLATGKKMFVIYCQTCHGVDGKGGSPVIKNDPANNIRRYPIPPPNLSGVGAITTSRSDGYIYLTIRNGGAIMPRYGAAMNDHEMWSVVAYIRTMEGAAATPPAPPADPQ